MSCNVKVAPHMQKCKEKEDVMRYPSIASVVIAVLFCLSLIALNAMASTPLCEVNVKVVGIEVAAWWACGSVR